MKVINTESSTYFPERSAMRETKNSATVSRVIKDAVSSGLVKPYDPEAGAKAMRYVPHWS